MCLGAIVYMLVLMVGPDALKDPPAFVHYLGVTPRWQAIAGYCDAKGVSIRVLPIWQNPA